MKNKLLLFLKGYIRLYLMRILYTVIGSFIGAVTLYIYLLNSRPELDIWHTVYLDEEFAVEKQAEIASFEQYLTLEEKLFEQLQTDIYSKSSTHFHHPRPA